MTTDEKLEGAWLCVNAHEDETDEQIACAHDLVCHGEGSGSHPQPHEDGDAACSAAVDREALKMLDDARYARDDGADETEFKRRWYAGRPS